MLFQGTYDTTLYRRVRDILHAEVEGRAADDAAWQALAGMAYLHRSPRPFSLALEA
jgi:hypothetical protein